MSESHCVLTPECAEHKALRLADAMAEAVEAFEDLFPNDLATDGVWEKIRRAKAARRAYIAARTPAPEAER